MKKKYLLIVTVFLSLFLLVGCGGKDNALVGEWKGLTDGESRDMQMETTFNFKSNGDVEYSNEFGINSTGTYEIKDDIVTIKLESWESAKEVGEWKGLTDGESRDMQMETTFNFKSNGDVEYSNEFGINSTGTYEIKDDIVTIKLESWESAKDYKFEVKDDKLSLTAQDVYSPSYSEMVKQ